MKSFLGSNSSGSKTSTVDTLIGCQSEVLGDVRFSGGLHLDGKIKGCVIAAGEKTATLSVSETGSIEGDVRVPNVVLNGSVIGDVRATERLTLAAKARVTGNVHYKVLQMEPGALINGQLMYEGSEAVAAPVLPKPAEIKPESQVIGLPEGRRVKAV